MAALEPAVRVLYWFRTDLRLHSSPGLHTALNLNPEVLYPVSWTYQIKVLPNFDRHGRFGHGIQNMSSLTKWASIGLYVCVVRLRYMNAISPVMCRMLIQFLQLQLSPPEYAGSVKFSD